MHWHVGMDPNMQRKSRNCFLDACFSGHAHIVQYLVQHTHADTEKEYDWEGFNDDETPRAGDWKKTGVRSH